MSPRSANARTGGGRLRGWAREIACFAAPLVVLGWSLRAPLASLGRGPWGAQDPWGNGDFVGNFWLWWREHELLVTGRDWFAASAWPGEPGLLAAFPNRLDAWAALPFYRLEHWWYAWNGLAVAFLVLAVLATVAAARAAGASRVAAAVGALVLAASPILLHELGWGRLATFQLWPGLAALACMAGAARIGRGRRALGLAVGAGLLLALQGLAYPFYALAAGAVGATALALSPLPWRDRGRLLGVLVGVAMVASLPWFLAERPLLAATVQAAPPAGYTCLPGAGLLGLRAVPERFRLLPVALPLGLLALGSRRARPWAVAGLLGVGLALGPRVVWLPEGQEVPSPLSWVMALHPWLARMHHPVRLAPFGLAGLAVAIALLLDPAGGRVRWLRWAGLAALAGLAVANQGAMTRATAWDQPGLPPGIGAARWLAATGSGPVADVLSGAHKAGFTLQPWHRRPLVESLQGYMAAAGATWSAQQAEIAAIIGGIARGEEPGEAGLEALLEAGVGALLVVDRRASRAGKLDPEPACTLLTATLGEPEYADGEAWVWRLEP